MSTRDQVHQAWILHQKTSKIEVDKLLLPWVPKFVIMFEKFGSSAAVVLMIWQILFNHDLVSPGVQIMHSLCTLNYLKQYSNRMLYAQLLVGLGKLLTQRLTASTSIHLFASLSIWKLMLWEFLLTPILLTQSLLLQIKFDKEFVWYLLFTDLSTLMLMSTMIAWWALMDLTSGFLKKGQSCAVSNSRNMLWSTRLLSASLQGEFLD